MEKRHLQELRAIVAWMRDAKEIEREHVREYPYLAGFYGSALASYADRLDRLADRIDQRENVLLAYLYDQAREDDLDAARNTARRWRQVLAEIERETGDKRAAALLTDLDEAERIVDPVDDVVESDVRP